MEKVESYLTKVVNTSIITVLKNSGRLKRTKSGFEKTYEISLESINPDDIKYSYDIPDPKENVEEQIITKDKLRVIADKVCCLQNEYPEKMYMDLFLQRYIKNLKQKEIAKNTGLSQSEVSKRLFELTVLLKSGADS